VQPCRNASVLGSGRWKTAVPPTDIKCDPKFNRGCLEWIPHHCLKRKVGQWSWVDNQTIIISGDSLSRELYAMLVLLFQSSTNYNVTETRIRIYWDGRQLTQPAVRKESSTSTPDCSEFTLDLDVMDVAHTKGTLRVIALLRSPYQSMECQVNELKALLAFAINPAILVTNLRLPHYLQWADKATIDREASILGHFLAEQATAIKSFIFQAPSAIHGHRYSFITPQRAYLFQRQVEILLTHFLHGKLTWTTLPTWSWTAARWESSWDGLHYVLGDRNTTMHYGIAPQSALALLNVLFK